jgi:predicted Co/Zn/Cd cation transporter (cation efflux family)
MVIASTVIKVSSFKVRFEGIFSNLTARITGLDLKSTTVFFALQTDNQRRFWQGPIALRRPLKYAQGIATKVISGTKQFQSPRR